MTDLLPTHTADTDTLDPDGGDRLINDVMAEAFKRAQVDDFTTKLDWLLDTLGPRLTAYAFQLGDARMLARWRAGSPRRDADAANTRAELLAEVAYAVTDVYSAATAASYIRSAQPALDGHSPAELIREEHTAESHAALQRRLRAATRAFLEG